jgi:hypothetical protein
VFAKLYGGFEVYEPLYLRCHKSAGWVDDSLYAIVTTDRSPCQASKTSWLDTYACRSAATIVYLSQPLVSVCWSFEETRIRPEGVVVEE